MFTKKNILTHLFFLIIAVGLKRYGVTAPDLTWNMFLALVALDFAILTNHTKSHILKVIAGLLWLFFYPNTFLHGDRHRPYALCQHSTMATRKHDSIYALCSKYFLWGHGWR